VRTLLAHARLEALFVAAEAARVALVLVDQAVLVEAAGVELALAHRAAEEALAAVAAGGAVVSPRGAIVADLARHGEGAIYETTTLRPTSQPSAGVSSPVASSSAA